MANFRQGDTTNIAFELSEALNGKKLKVGIYNTAGKPMFETTTEDGLIEQVDSTHYMLTLHWEVTRNFSGATTLRLAVYTPDKGFVNAGEQAMSINWVNEPVTRKLQ